MALSSDETIEGYALRKLKEAQNVQKTAQYTRRYIPDVLPGDVVKLNYPAQELNGLYQIETQSITLGYAARTQEGVRLWTE